MQRKEGENKMEHVIEIKTRVNKGSELETVATYKIGPRNLIKACREVAEMQAKNGITTCAFTGLYVNGTEVGYDDIMEIADDNIVFRGCSRTEAANEIIASHRFARY